jgi:hypothetical protein
MFTDVYDGSEIVVEIGSYNGSSWDYETVAYRRGLNIDIPSNTRPVYDRLDFRGNKKTRGENSLSISQEFQGFDTGLKTYEETNGLIVKVTITPNDGSTPTDPVRYYSNWCTDPLELGEIPDEGEFNASLNGKFNKEIVDEPVDDDF